MLDLVGNPKTEAHIIFQVLKDILTICLKEAHGSKFTSLAMPALGTGFLRYPADMAATATLEALESFVENNPKTKLKDISVIVYYKDTDSYKV